MDIRIWDGYKLELHTPETTKLFSSTKEFIEKTKIGEKVPSLEVAEVVSVECNSVYNNCQQKS